MKIAFSPILRDRWDDLLNMVSHIAIFAAVGVVLGYYMPKVFFEYIDKTQYYTIEIPISVDKRVYKPCDRVTWIIKRNSKIDFEAVSTVELVLIKDNEEVARETRPLFIEKGDAIVRTKMTLPCLLDTGEYRYHGIIVFRHNEVTKHLTLKTEPFWITNEATDSGEFTL